MSFFLDNLEKASVFGEFVRVVVSEAKGSVPREPGAEMLVFADRTEGTIGGGTLEHRAILRARGLVEPCVERIPLGPALGQCCGGSVTLVYEPLDAATLAAVAGRLAGGGLHARPVAAEAPAAPSLAVLRALRRLRGEGATAPRLVDGWLIEALAPAPAPLWIWGAGHVGRAIAAVVAPLPGFNVTLIDTEAARFPNPLPPGVTQLVAADPVVLVPHAPAGAHHLVLTFSHALDLALCHGLLAHGFASLGLIGSATKAARFRSRLVRLGHSDAQISRIACPIGDPGLGKHPHAIAVGVAAALLRQSGAGMAAGRPASRRRGTGRIG